MQSPNIAGITAVVTRCNPAEAATVAGRAEYPRA